MNKLRMQLRILVMVVVSLVFGMSVWSCATEIVEESTTEYPKQGARSSNFVEGPHLVYDKDSVMILQSVELNGEMSLTSKQFDRAGLSEIVVNKSGYLPRTFNVKLKNQIKSEPSVYHVAETIFAVSDIEGNFNTLVNLLQQHGVINSNLEWSFGSGHFVFIGDIFDRGNHVTEMLWFLYGLEAQAAEHEGYVHILLGNHEAMNLRGDLRYIEPKYSAFSELAKQQYGIDHTILFSDRTELGRWLRSKNVIEKIGDKIFVRAGISPALVESGFSLEAINELSWKTLNTPKPEFTDTDKLIWGKSGPFWYRGYFDVDEERWGPVASQADVETALEQYGGSHIIVGHTHVEKPELRYEGKICAIDVVPPADHLVYSPPLQAYGVLIQDKDFFIADENGQLVKLLN